MSFELHFYLSEFELRFHFLGKPHGIHVRP